MNPQKLSLLIVTIILAVGPSRAQDKPIEGPLRPFLGEPSMALQQVFKGERFPNVVVTLKGTVLATWGSSSVRVRRSEDGGETWGPEITIARPGFQGGGTTVDETTGDILAFVEAHHPPADLTVYRSQDDGKTWKPQPTKILPDSNAHVPSMHMNEHGITLRHGKHKGRLVRPSRWYAGKNDRARWPDHYTNAIYSDDGGKTWQTSEPFPENGTGEATVAELSDGRLYYNSRVHWQERPKNTRRRCAFSDDGGQTWKDWRIVDILPDGHQHRSYGCMGGLARLPVANQDILIFSNIDTPNARRERGTVWASFDGGRTWPVKRLVFDGPSAYSSLTAGRPGTPSEGKIYLHFEGGPSGGSTVARFNLTWLLAGEPTGDGTIPQLVTTLNQALALPMTFSFDSETLEPAVRRLTKHVQASLPIDSSLKVDIKVLAGDLKLDGFTRNQTIRDFKQHNQPLRNVLTSLVQKANGNHTVKDPSKREQRIVWVVGPDPDDVERQVILITTRQMAEVRSYKLPDVFIAKKPSP